MIRQRYFEVAIETINQENENARKASNEIKLIDIEEEEKKNPKLKETRIISIKGKNNSTINM